jgi:hypothetical protein
MKYVECPGVYRRNAREKSLFLGGGITSCPQWQPIMVGLLSDTDLAVLNPRRQQFDVTDPAVEEEQIIWEFRHMERATAILFWFCAETLCPITLFEYGKWVTQDKPLFVGHHPEYRRRNDLRIQTRLVRRRQKVHDSLEAMAEEVKKWVLK